MGHRVVGPDDSLRFNLLRKSRVLEGFKCLGFKSRKEDSDVLIVESVQFESVLKMNVEVDGMLVTVFNKMEVVVPIKDCKVFTLDLDPGDTVTIENCCCRLVCGSYTASERDETPKTNRTDDLVAVIKELLEVIGDGFNENSATDGANVASCPLCGHKDCQGHRKDCALAVAAMKAEALVKEPK